MAAKDGHFSSTRSSSPPFQSGSDSAAYFTMKLGVRILVSDSSKVENTMSSNYLPLPKLVKDWSRQSGELPEVVLTHLCNQDSHGRFPRATFRLRDTGGYSSPGQLGEHVALMRTASYDSVRKTTTELYHKVVVSKEGVLTYCSEFDVRPPRSVAGIRKWFAARKAKYDSPPPYPATPEEEAEERERLEAVAAEAEAANLRSLESSIEAGLEGLERQFGQMDKIGDDPKNGAWKYRSGIWLGERNFVQADIDCLPEGELKKRLESKMSRLVESYQERAARISEKEDEDLPQECRATAYAEACARRFLERCILTGKWRPKATLFDDARAEIGDGLSERAFNRAWRDIAPPEWRRRGRRSDRENA